VAGTGLAVGGAICALSNDFLDSLNRERPEPPAGRGDRGRFAAPGPPCRRRSTGNAEGASWRPATPAPLWPGRADSGRHPGDQPHPGTDHRLRFRRLRRVQSPHAVGSTGGAIKRLARALTLPTRCCSIRTPRPRQRPERFSWPANPLRRSRDDLCRQHRRQLRGAIFSGARTSAVDSSRFIANGSPGASARRSTPSPWGAPSARRPGRRERRPVGTLFSQNTGVPLWDVDFGGASPVNTLQYNGNDFFQPDFRRPDLRQHVHRSRRGGLRRRGLNNVIVNRFGGPRRSRRRSPNRAPFASPGRRIAQGDPDHRLAVAPSTPFLAYAWAGGSATLNGVPLPRHEGLIERRAPRQLHARRGRRDGRHRPPSRAPAAPRTRSSAWRTNGSTSRCTGSWRRERAATATRSGSRRHGYSGSSTRGTSSWCQSARRPGAQPPFSGCSTAPCRT